MGNAYTKQKPVTKRSSFKIEELTNVEVHNVKQTHFFVLGTGKVVMTKV